MKWCRKDKNKKISNIKKKVMENKKRCSKYKKIEKLKMNIDRMWCGCEMMRRRKC